MRNIEETSSRTNRPAAGAWLTGLGLALLVLIPAWVLIVSGDFNGRGAFDQLNYHEPAIVRFAQQWPKPDLSNYLSATTPGYHLILAAAARVFGSDRVILQLIGSLFTGLLFVLLGVAVARRVGPRRAIGLLLPLAGSMYVFFPAVWLLPDNAGWLLVLGVLLIALSGCFGARTLLAFTLAASALVLVRQVHLWVLAPMWTAAYFGAAARPGTADHRAAWDIPALFGPDLRGAIPRLAAIIGLSAVPCAILGAFVREWGGLTPPYFLRHQGANPAAPAFILAVFGALGPFFIPASWPALARTLSHNRFQIAGAMLVAFLLAIAVPTTYDKDAGRWTGLWNLARATPGVADRSILIVALATLGGGLLMALLGTLGRRDRWIFASTVVGFMAALGATHEIWHRYVEPLVLVLLPLMVARGQGSPVAGGSSLGPSSRRLLDWGQVGVCALGVGLAFLTTLTIARAKPVQDLRFYTRPEFEVRDWRMPPGVLSAEPAMSR